MTRFTARVATILLASMALAAVPAHAQTQTFAPTGAEQTFTVPAGVTSVQVTATGQEGVSQGVLSPGGLPATVSGTLPAAPGSALYVEVAGPGFNGGGGPGGGGASDVRTLPAANPATLASRQLVAGGGGGAGAAGGLVLTALAGGDSGAAGLGPGCGGGAGTQTSGGAAGSGTSAGTVGSLGSGGTGGAGGGGDGGGGLFGGGGGGVSGLGLFSAGCGGGGGSSLVPSGGTSGLAVAGTPASVQISPIPPAAGGGSGLRPSKAKPDKTKPSVTGFFLSPRTFQAARSGSALAAAVGGTVSYRLSEPATTTFTVERAAKGRRKGGRCARPTKKNRKAKSCTRYVKVAGKFTHAGKAGDNTFSFRGRIGGRKLKPERYRLVGVAKDKAGNKSNAVRAIFRIKK